MFGLNYVIQAVAFCSLFLDSLTKLLIFLLRAAVFNAGYIEAIKYFDWSCYVFHDVDLLPEDDRC